MLESSLLDFQAGSKREKNVIFQARDEGLKWLMNSFKLSKRIQRQQETLAPHE